MAVATGYNGGNQLIAQPNFVRSIDVTSADFDGTDTANVADALKTSEQNGSKFNPWKKNGGFLVLPSGDGIVDVLTWGDYKKNGKVVNDSLMQSIPVLGGAWQETRVVKVYDSSTVSTMNIGTIA
jgi:hypothetical protein